KQINTEVVTSSCGRWKGTERSPGVKPPVMGVRYFMKGSQRTRGTYSPKITSRCLRYLAIICPSGSIRKLLLKYSTSLGLCAGNRGSASSDPRMSQTPCDLTKF